MIGLMRSLLLLSVLLGVMAVAACGGGTDEDSDAFLQSESAAEKSGDCCSPARDRSTSRGDSSGSARLR